MNRRKILGFAIGPIGSAVLGIVSVPVIAWYFSSEDIGRISMLQIACDFVVILFGLGLDRAYVREYHETSGNEKPMLLITAVAPGFLLLFSAIVALNAYKPTLLAALLFSIENQPLSNLVIYCFFAAFLARFFSLVLRMQEKGTAFSMSQILPKLIFLMLVGIYVFFIKHFDFESLVVAHTASLISVMLIFSWNTRSTWVRGLINGINLQKMLYMLKFGLPLVLASLAFWILMAMDKLFLKSLSSYEQLGIYSVAISVASAAGVVSSIFTTIWAPTVYKWTAEGVNTALIDQVSEHVLAVASAIIVGCGLFSWILKFVLPSEYVNVQFIVVSCVASILFNTLSETNAVGIGIARKSFYSLIAAILAAVFNAVGNYMLVPKLGSVGACISTATAFWVFLLIRTEFASYVWRSLPRLKLYAVTLTLLIFAIGFSVFGNIYPVVWLSIWGVASLIWFYLFWPSFVALLYELRIKKMPSVGQVKLD